MRSPRILAEPGLSGVYHCMSRVVGATHLLDDECKEKLTLLLHKLATFCEVQIHTYCIMSNHFHLLIRVPPPRDLTTFSDEELLKKILEFYGTTSKRSILAASSVAQGMPIPDSLRKSIVCRIRNLSAFLQEFKQRFSRWYNARKDRSGYFWAERFKSVLVEDSAPTIRAVAAYIDLNPVRAGLVQDPGDYPHSGYSAALSGNARAQSGFMSFLSSESWSQALSEYRAFLFVTSGRAGASGKVALDPDVIRTELKRGAPLEPGQVLRLHIRHLSDGVVVGTKDFVNRIWEKNRKHFGAKRTSGARPIRGVPLNDITSIRDLRKSAIE